MKIIFSKKLHNKLFVTILNNDIFAKYMINLIEIKGENLFHFSYHGKEIEMTFCELLSLRNKINTIDITSHFNADANTFGIEILSLCNLKHILILNTQDILTIKPFLEQVFTPEKFTPIVV